MTQVHGEVRDSNTERLEHVNVDTVHAKRVLVSGYSGTAINDIDVDGDGHLQVDVLSGGGGGTLVPDGAAASAGTTGQLVLGLDGSNYQALNTDADEHLQIDVLTGGGGGTLVTDGAAVSAASTGVLVLGTDGSNYQLVKTDADGELQIDVVSMPTIAVSAVNLDIRDLASATDSVSALITNSTGASAVNIQDGGNTITVDGSLTVDLGANNDVTAVGTVADDGTTPGAPVMVGGTAKETDGSDPGSVSAEDDIARLITDRNRRLLVNNVHPNLWSALISGTGSATATQVKAAPGSNLSLHLTDLVISTDTAMNIMLLESASASAAKGGTYYLAANGGVAMPFTTPLRFSANTPIAYRASKDGNYTILCNGYTAP